MPGGYGRVQGCSFRLPLGLRQKKYLEVRFPGKKKKSIVEAYVGDREEVQCRRQRT